MMLPTSATQAAINDAIILKNSKVKITFKKIPE
jgi:hypothetical protein